MYNYKNNFLNNELDFSLTHLVYTEGKDNFYNYNIKFSKQSIQKNIQTNLNKRNKELFFKKNFIEKLNSHFLKKGKKKKTLKQLYLGFNLFFTLLAKNFHKKKKKFKNFNIFLNSIINDSNLQNFNNIFIWILSFCKYSFFFKTKKLPKFLKRKLKKKYVIEPLVIKKNVREKYTLKYFYFFIEKSKSADLINRAYYSFEDILLSYTDSIFYLYKVIALKKVIKQLRKI